MMAQNEEEQVTVWSVACDNPSATNLVRDGSRFPDDTTAKVRKPYTITKQRERWTDEEHQKFIEAVKLYGRSWRQIEEHVGTKTAVQIRSHAQKFFSKLEREGSSGGSNSKGPVLEIDIPPPRPKRKPAHPYPRKDAILGRSASMPSRPAQLSGNKSSGCEDTIPFIPFSNNEVDAPSSETTPRVTSSTKIRKRGTEKIQDGAFHNESQDVQKLSIGNCSEPEQTSSPLIVAQSDKVIMQHNDIPFGAYGPKLLEALHHPMAMAYHHHPVHSFPGLQNGSPSQHVKVDNLPPALAGLVAAHAQLSTSLMPWIPHNPVAMAAAAAAAATGSWPGFVGLPPPLPLPLPLPVRPSVTFNDQQNKESTNSVAAAALAAAAAASFADASAWFALHGAMSNPPIIPEVKSLFKPNPLVQSTMMECQEKQHLTNSSEGSKNEDNPSEQISSEEQEVSTRNDIQAAEQYNDSPKSTTSKHFLPSTNHLPTSDSAMHDHDPAEDEGKPGHNSSTGSSNNGKQGRNKTCLNGCTSAFVLVGLKNGMHKSYLTMTSKKIEKASTEADSIGVDDLLNMYQSSNSPGSGTSTRISESGEGPRYDDNNKHTEADCHMHEQCDTSTGRRNNQVDAQDITREAVQVDIGASDKGSIQTGNEEITCEASIAPIRQCISSCGSTEYQKVSDADSPLESSTINKLLVQEYAPKDNMKDSTAQISPHEKAGKALVQACLKKWQGGRVMAPSRCSNPNTCRAEAKEEESQLENEARAKGFTNTRSQPQIRSGSTASSSGSNKYCGHGFVPYRRS